MVTRVEGEKDFLEVFAPFSARREAILFAQAYVTDHENDVGAEAVRFSDPKGYEKGSHCMACDWEPPEKG